MTRTIRGLGIAAKTLGGIAATLCLIALLFVGVGPRYLGYRTLTVLTGSMRPSMPAGSLVVAKPVPVAQLRAGDIFVFQAPIADRRIVSHRVVSIKQDGSAFLIQTKGDANPDVDPWLARVESPTVWRVKTILPGVGAGIRFLRGDAVHMALTYGIPALLAMIWLGEIWRKPPRVRQPASYA